MMGERVKMVPTAADQVVNELEALAKPLVAAIATARRIHAISLPGADDVRNGNGLFQIARGFGKEFRGAVAAAERFARNLKTLEEAMQKTADRVSWHQRGEF